jgi:hypothetical protein
MWPSPRFLFLGLYANALPSIECHVLGTQVDGADISKVLIPSFFLEPRSLLEKYSVRDGINSCLPPELRTCCSVFA